MKTIDDLIGKELTPEIEQQLKANYASVRIMRPGFMYTMDFRTDRLCIRVNDKNIIQSHSFG